MSRSSSDRGQASVIIVGFAFVILMLVVVVVDASAAYLKRQSLDSLADGAALRGADLAAQGEEVYSGGLDEGDLALSRAEAHAAVRTYLREVGARRDHPGLTYTVSVSADRIVVRVTAPADLPLQLPGGAIDTTVTSTGSAVVRPEVD
ncbi:hypothetical protein KUV85_00765 [Nocardioides panacisoli]|uniref:pilus assembly protein TadG-related protein n=1 Tax=Nocardioides panacisoli TaxID=627624 RepID=UPI001C63464B|nr:pilus assembly protein TadG-related protein [Nocardioides panacisoli]QYJ04246.1 hypothetical protein KUV85_00765 [Nocardioides panacisoli]